MITPTTIHLHGKWTSLSKYQPIRLLHFNDPRIQKNIQYTIQWRHIVWRTSSDLFITMMSVLPDIICSKFFDRRLLFANLIFSGIFFSHFQQKQISVYSTRFIFNSSWNMFLNHWPNCQKLTHVTLTCITGT